jgi:hypothetical protein
MPLGPTVIGLCITLALAYAAMSRRESAPKVRLTRKIGG